MLLSNGLHKQISEINMNFNNKNFEYNFQNIIYYK